ncbi:MAG: hypothetical protein OXU45_10095 [Candidatus Melainabacteria bacterium]|nr:hypothetical protein [Candidatus Melainabacteria bacterium]
MQGNKKLRFDLISAALQQVLALLEDGTWLAGLEPADKSLSLHGQLDHIAQAMIQAYKARTDEKFWQVYWSLLEQASSEHEDFEYNPVFEREHIDFAIRNAFFYYLSAIALIPDLYQRSRGRVISAQEYREAARKIMELGYHLSKFHFDVFRAFVYATSKTKSGVSSNLHQYDLACFELSEDLVLAMSDRARDLIQVEAKKLDAKAKLRIDQPTIGCPALYASGGQINMIELLYQQVLAYLDSVSFFDSSLEADLLVESI